MDRFESSSHTHSLDIMFSLYFKRSFWRLSQPSVIVAAGPMGRRWRSENFRKSSLRTEIFTFVNVHTHIISQS